jgi:hypothetical protein
MPTLRCYRSRLCPLFGWLLPMTAVSALALAAAVTATSAVVSAGAGVSVWMITVRAGFAVVASLRRPGVKPGRTSTSGPLQACGLKCLSAGCADCLGAHQVGKQALATLLVRTAWRVLDCVASRGCRPAPWRL